MNSQTEMMELVSQVCKLMFSYMNSMSLKCAVELGIPDIIHNHGKPMTFSSLVEALSIPPERTNHFNRLLRFLIHSRFFTMKKLDENEEGIDLTPLSSLVIKGNPHTMSSLVLAMVNPVLITPMDFLGPWFQGKSGESTAFEIAHGVQFWNFTEQNPKFGKVFDDAMANISLSQITAIVNEGKEVFQNLKSLVDVGGGNGAVAHVICESFPDLKCFVLDLPNVVANVPKIHDNIDFIGGDMFESIPHADAILLKHTLHNWNDDDSIKILKKCREAIPTKGGKVIIVEVVVQHEKSLERPPSDVEFYMDLMMMTTFASKERTEEEWKKLLVESGFSDYKITYLMGHGSIIEAFP
uniref:10-hydroxychelerythrine O-methyltransferase n=1 Tax=Eschscholzia californica subsp. californica TaxID=222997 RepID=A0A224ALY9_ESCCA|nr:10-hydroxychelerythrine O-methyltransferase [Eschscholzia californica subsp. californica]